ncbi:linear amide C-N hydrolase [Acidithiobacillus sp. AMEEHan]|uniref:linear amide C-N hydrolase n=1 Tax=Acidithiobacillus sp. AMEEHan TaxID=2994951 RepID=UPI0027E4ABD7|nr:linear amide C-N hydrolase [Acidithiobacillus sp. AMEEHan]
MAISAWAQYFLDNFATVQDALHSLQTHPVCLLSAPIPGTDRFTTLHLSLSDSSGNSAVLEYIDGKLVIYVGRQYQVLTNDPEYSQPLAVASYWPFQFAPAPPEGLAAYR